MAEDLFSWAERPPAPSPPAERSFGADDKSHREKVRELLDDGEWHTSRALMQVGGTRFGARVQELRDRGLTIECQPVEGDRGAWVWRLVKDAPPAAPRRPTWKERALAAEARVLELEAQLHGGK